MKRVTCEIERVIAGIMQSKLCCMLLACFCALTLHPTSDNLAVSALDIGNYQQHHHAFVHPLPLNTIRSRPHVTAMGLKPGSGGDEPERRRLEVAKMKRYTSKKRGLLSLVQVARFSSAPINGTGPQSETTTGWEERKEDKSISEVNGNESVAFQVLDPSLGALNLSQSSMDTPEPLSPLQEVMRETMESTDRGVQMPTSETSQASSQEPPPETAPVLLPKNETSQTSSQETAPVLLPQDKTSQASSEEEPPKTAPQAETRPAESVERAIQLRRSAESASERAASISKRISAPAKQQAPEQAEQTNQTEQTVSSASSSSSPPSSSTAEGSVPRALVPSGTIVQEFQKDVEILRAQMAAVAQDLDSDPLATVPAEGGGQLVRGYVYIPMRCPVLAFSTCVLLARSSRALALRAVRY